MVAFPEWKDDEVRTLHVGVSGAAQVPLSDPDGDELTLGRLVPHHGSPARVVIPITPYLRRQARGFQLSVGPELDGGRAVPLPADVETHPQRVLNTPAAAKARFGPTTRPRSLREVDKNRVGRKVDARDSCRLGPASDAGRVIEKDRLGGIERRVSE